MTKIPRGGSLLDSNDEELIYGEVVSGTVRIRCNRRSIAHVAQSSKCINETWHPPIPDCTCAPLNSSAISTVCSYSDREQTSCSEPLPGITSEMSCPKKYFHDKQSLICGTDGEWRSHGRWDKCRHQCGNYEDSNVKWLAIITYIETDHSECFGSILNSVYIITHTDCVKDYKPNDLYIWTWELTYSIQSFEYGGKFTLVRSKKPFVFTEKTTPICLGDYKKAFGTHSHIVADPYQHCNNANYDEKGVYVGSKCLVNGTDCIYSFGSGHTRSSKFEREGIKRLYLHGIGERAMRTGENKDGFYECDITNWVPFDEPEYVELDLFEYL